MPTSPTKAIPKAVLYYDQKSVWSSAVRIALEEKGYGDDEVDLRIVHLEKGENYSPSFLRLNPNGTVPTLIVPFEDTLSADTESRYKAVTDITAIIQLLDRSRSMMSRTHTTSYAPAPALSPATISLSSLSTTIINLIHSGPASPEVLFFFNARDVPTLRSVSKSILPFLRGRNDALARYLSENETNPIRVSEKTKKFWNEKKRTTEEMLPAMASADKDDAQLSAAEKKAREEYFESTKAAWEVGLSLALTQLSKELIGPYSLGDQFSITDIHVTAWLAWLVGLSGGSVTDSGAVAIGRLEQHIGGGFSLAKDAIPPSAQVPSVDGPAAPKVDAQAKLAIIWDAVKERASWKKVYGSGI